MLDTLKVIQDASGLAYEVMGDEAALQRRFPQLNMRTGEEAMLTDGGAPRRGRWSHSDAAQCTLYG